MEPSFGSFRGDLNLAGDVDISKIDAECKEACSLSDRPRPKRPKTAEIKVNGQPSALLTRVTRPMPLHGH